MVWVSPNTPGKPQLLLDLFKVIALASTASCCDVLQNANAAYRDIELPLAERPRDEVCHAAVEDFVKLYDCSNVCEKYHLALPVTKWLANV